jgi:hypothetical protein
MMRGGEAEREKGEWESRKECTRSIGRAMTGLEVVNSKPNAGLRGVCLVYCISLHYFRGQFLFFSSSSQQQVSHTRSILILILNLNLLIMSNPFDKVARELELDGHKFKYYSLPALNDARLGM